MKITVTVDLDNFSYGYRLDPTELATLVRRACPHTIGRGAIIDDQEAITKWSEGALVCAYEGLRDLYED